MSPPEIGVTGIGLRTSVGNDSIQSAAIVRAGLDRFAAWPDFPLWVEDEPTLVVAGTRPLLGDGPWTSKIEPLIGAPTREALWTARLFDLASVRMGAWLAVPHRDRPGTTHERHALFVSELSRDWPGDLQPAQVKVVAADHVGGLLALDEAVRDLSAGRIDYAIVGAVDSFLHGPVLEQLLAQGRLKSLATAAGLIPGEAGAVLVLETVAAARRRSVPVLARVGALAIDREAAYSPEAPVRGEAMARALRAVLEREETASFHRVLVDLSGERWRFLEWAVAETRALSRLPAGYVLEHPADRLGDVGAASALVFAALTVRAFNRGYAGPGSVLLATASAQGERAALALHPPHESKG
jgi:3-oxoacyl-[acyl-carrier-protein] synthase I